MKSIPNTISSIKKDDTPNSKNATFADLILIALNTPPPNGFTPSIMRQRARIDAALEKVKPGDVIKLEDADVATVKAALENCQWRIRHKDLLALFDFFGV